MPLTLIYIICQFSYDTYMLFNSVNNIEAQMRKLSSKSLRNLPKIIQVENTDCGIQTLGMLIYEVSFKQ